MTRLARKAIVLAAGLGTRLAPLTDERPKPMLPVGGVPLLEHILLALKRCGVAEAGINLHHRPEVVRGHFGDGGALGLRLRYSVEKALLGTAGALNRFRDFVDRPVLIYYGDVFTRMDLNALWDAHEAGGALLTMGLYRVDEPTRCGIVALEGDAEPGGAGRVTRFREKPREDEVFSDLANAGLYVIEPEVLDAVPESGESDFGRDVIPALLKQGKPVHGLVLQDEIIDIGTMANYALAQQRAQHLRRAGE